MSVKILTGDCRVILPTLDAESVQCVVTSPPYWGLRDYGVEGQLGLERTPEEYVANLVTVFGEVRRVLRDDGTLWLNLGDSYSANAGQRKTTDRAGIKQQSNTASVAAPSRCVPALGAKQLVGMPWRVALALQANGWILRQEIIWSKLNPMPESVDDRPTRAHEQIFLFAKALRYYYDADAIKEPVSGTAHARGSGVNPKAKAFGANSRVRVDRVPAPRPKQNESFSAAVRGLVDDRNKRSVWTTATQPFSGAHFATFPPELIRPCILAGSRVGDTVLDPFLGAGTTALVADRLGRHCVGVELNADYAAMAHRRLTDDAPLFVEASAGDDAPDPAPIPQSAVDLFDGAA